MLLKYCLCAFLIMDLTEERITVKRAASGTLLKDKNFLNSAYLKKTYFIDLRNEPSGIRAQIYEYIWEKGRNRGENRKGF